MQEWLVVQKVVKLNLEDFCIWELSVRFFKKNCKTKEVHETLKEYGGQKL